MTTRTTSRKRWIQGFVTFGAAAILSSALAGCGDNAAEPTRQNASVTNQVSAAKQEGGSSSDYADITDTIRNSVAAMAALDGPKFDSTQCRAYRPAPGAPDSFSDLLDGGTQKGVYLIKISRISVKGNSATAAYTLKYPTLEDTSPVESHFVNEGGKWLFC